MTQRLWSAGSYYYGTNEIVGNVFKVSVEFVEPIEFGILREALDRTQKRYPYFSVKRVKTPSEILLEDNPLPWVLGPGEKPITLGGPESNGHMIAFRYKGNWLYADVFHGMTDATGFLNLLRTLCYYYCRGAYDSGIPSGSAWLVGEPISQEEIEDPFLRLPPQAEGNAPGQKKPKYMCLAEENRYDCTRNHVFRLDIPQKALMKYCGENDGSPATAAALFLARAIHRVHKDSQKPIGCGMAVNLRGALGTERSHQSTILLPVLTFTEHIAQLPLAMQGTAFRGQVLLKCDADALMGELYGFNRFYEFINGLPTVQAKEQTMRKVIESEFKAATVSVSYVGRSNLGACEKYIRRLYTEASGSGIMLEVNAINDVFCLEWSQEWEEKTYFEGFCRELDACGIPYTITEDGPLNLSRLAELP